MFRSCDDSDAGECPFLEDADPRCAARFNLGHMAQAFDLCLGRFDACAVYHQLRTESRRESIVLTIAGRPAAPLPLGRDAAETVVIQPHPPLPPRRVVARLVRRRISRWLRPTGS